SMHPFAPRSDDETFSKRSMVLSSWSGILALGYGGIMTWVRALKNERKLFHLAKMEYERNRQQQEQDMDSQRIEITKHLKRAAAAGAAAVAQKQQYEKAIEELSEQHETSTGIYSDRSMMHSSSLAENERAWSEQLYQAMDMEAFSVAEKAMDRRWEELNGWSTQIEQLRNRNKAQEENIRQFRATREERIKDQFDHFEGERERLVRLAQELEALKMDVEEYKEETRVKEEERNGELNAREEYLQKKDLDLKIKEEGVLDKFYEPITLLVSPPISIDERGYEVEETKSTAEDTLNSEANEPSPVGDGQESTETSLQENAHKGSDHQAEQESKSVTQSLEDSLREPSLRVNEILRFATQALNIRPSEETEAKATVDEQEANEQSSTIVADSPAKEVVEKSNSSPATRTVLEESDSKVSSDPDPVVEEDAVSVDIHSQHEAADNTDDLQSIQDEEDEAKEMISHDDNEEEEEANEIASVTEHHESPPDTVIVETAKDDTIKTTEGDDCVDDLVEIFKAGSDKSLSMTQHTDIVDDQKDDTMHTMQSEAHTMQSEALSKDASTNAATQEMEEPISAIVPSMDSSTPSDEDTETRVESRTIQMPLVQSRRLAQKIVLVEPREDTERTEANASVSTRANSENPVDRETEPIQEKKTLDGEKSICEAKTDGDEPQKPLERSKDSSLDLVPFVGDVAETIFKSAMASLFSQLPGQEGSTVDAEQTQEVKKMSLDTTTEQPALLNDAPAAAEETPSPAAVLDISAPEKAKDESERFPEYDEEADPVIVTKATGDSYLIDCRSQEELKQMLSDKPPLFSASTDEDALGDTTDGSVGSFSEEEEDRDDDDDDQTEFEDARHDFSHSSDNLGSASQESGSSSGSGNDFQDAKADVTSSTRRTAATSPSEQVPESDKDHIKKAYDEAIEAFSLKEDADVESDDVPSSPSTESTSRHEDLVVSVVESEEDDDDNVSSSALHSTGNTTTTSTTKVLHSDQTSLLVDCEEVEVV
ncbi:MAG: hypothetical protein SGILL_007556, partial [Bacillariaceae sp.]